MVVTYKWGTAPDTQTVIYKSSGILCYKGGVYVKLLLLNLPPSVASYLSAVKQTLKSKQFSLDIPVPKNASKHPTPSLQYHLVLQYNSEVIKSKCLRDRHQVCEDTSAAVLSTLALCRRMGGPSDTTKQKGGSIITDGPEGIMNVETGMPPI